MKRCEKCILPDNYPGISFDEKGICNRCHEWAEQYALIDYAQLRSNLDQLMDQKIREARQHHLPWDVVVPISGGKDSAFVLYVMKTIYKCRILAVNYYNTFQTVQAYRNLLALINHFDVDFRMISIRPELLKNAYRFAFESIGEFCLICNCTGYWVLLSFLSGQFSSYGYTPMVVGGWSKLYEYDPQINTLNFLRYRELLEQAGLLDRFKEVLDEQILDQLSGEQDVRQVKSGGFIQLPDYWPWEPDTILQTLKSSGWQAIRNQETHFDCWASPVADAVERAKYKVNQKTTILATYVRAGFRNREKALVEDELSLIQLTDMRLLEEFSRHTGIPLKNLEQRLDNKKL